MNDIMYEKMIELTNEEKLVSVYYYDDNDNFDVGFIANVGEDNYILKNVSKNGKYNGYILGTTSNICALGIEELYLEDILRLYTKNERKHSSIIFKDDNLTIELLKYAMKKEYVISMEINQSGDIDVQGIVVSVDEDCITIEKLSDSGIKDGLLSIDTTSIDKIYCNTDNEKKIRELSEI